MPPASRHRSNTGTQPTPIEETEPTAPPQPAPSPVEPEPQSTPEPTAEEMDEAASRRAQAEAEAPAINPFGFIGRMLNSDYRAGYTAAQAAIAEREEYPLTVHEAIAEVTRRVEAIAKDRTASQGGSYKYRGIDDVLSALHPLLGDVGLVILPGRVIREQWETRATSSGGTLNVARLLIRYRLIGPDGSRASGEAWGEGGDSGDKATQKAHSQSYKSFALQLFSIPTEDSSRDEPDATNPPARPFTAEEQERAGRAYEAALEADSVEKLAGVRSRALALLDVPVRMVDGSAVPLGLLFDSRRTALDTTGRPS